MSRLLDAAGDSPFIFVTGKGGTGKTTTAGAIALELADSGIETHLISTDPAHSLGDLFGEPVGAGIISSCSPDLFIEELDAEAAAAAWVERALGPVSELVELGTYLDADDVGAFSRLALPGVDEAMAVLRLAELARGGKRVIVDTAPTGHTLRMLDAAALHEGLARALRGMADKAIAVGGALTGRAVRLTGEDFIDELHDAVATWHERVLGRASFVIVARPGAVIAAETRLLARELRARSLALRAVVMIGDSSGDPPLDIDAPIIPIPLLCDVTGCDGLRRLRSARTADQSQDIQPNVRTIAGAQRLIGTAPQLVLFAGKGGVGKSTCATAAALLLAADRDVLLCSTDPAGSLDDVLGPEPRLPPRLRVLQIDAAAELARLHGSYRDEIMAALEQLGLSESATLDRHVLDALWDVAPPGLDEMAGTAALLRAAHDDETLVIDSAPTGHFLRLLEMPETALAWTRQLMRVIVKYGLAGVAERAAQSLIDLSRELRHLSERLRDPVRSAVFVVTLDEPMVRAETDRLIRTLERAQIPIGGVIFNRATRAAKVGRGLAVVIAPPVEPAPVGTDRLREFVESWKIVT